MLKMPKAESTPSTSGGTPSDTGSISPKPSHPARKRQSTSKQGRASPTNADQQQRVSKQRLTAHQKNTNHKDAENKRRNAIRDQFSALSYIVPGTEGQERSEYVMLQKSVSYLREILEERRELISQVEKRGGIVEDRLRLTEKDYGGRNWQTKNMDEFEKQRARRPGAGDDDGED